MMKSKSSSRGQGKEKNLTIARIALLRESIARHLLLSYGILIALVFLSLVSYLRFSHVFPIKSVQVTGNRHFLTNAQLQQLVLADVQKGFFAVDVAAIQEIIAQQPGIKSVSVRKNWPATVSIKVTEWLPFAHWGQAAYVNQTGQIFTPRAQQNIQSNLPTFIASADMAKSLIQFYQTYTPKLAKLNLSIAKIKVNQQHSWQLSLNNGIQLLLGRDALAKHMQRFFIAYRKVFARQADAVATVDLRYPNGMAVKWRQ